MNLIEQLRATFLGVRPPTNVHSLENLKYLYGVLQENPIVSCDNSALLNETLRSISEILIWGDQHDSSVFDYCFERGIMTFFLDYMRQRNGRFICAQILQTLNILFQNIRQQTSLYFLLSNNHVNNIIIHKFDFSDEEITAFYISFLRTLSLKLTHSTINFFFSEKDQQFPLYIEAIKFFNHPDKMVRIAIRTLTLNVYNVRDPSMHRFIFERTAEQYFSNLIWFIRNLILDFDYFIRENDDVINRSQLTSSVEEYLDHIHYLRDIFTFGITNVNQVLKDQWMNRLLIPICVFSLINNEASALGRVTTLFLLAEIFVVIDYRLVVEELTDLILSADRQTAETIEQRYREQKIYRLPPIPLDISLASLETKTSKENGTFLNVVDINNEEDRLRYEAEKAESLSKSPPRKLQEFLNEKSVSLYVSNRNHGEQSIRINEQQLKNRPYLSGLIEALRCEPDDQVCFYGLCLLLAMSTNSAIDASILDSVGLTFTSSDKNLHNTVIVDRLCEIVEAATAKDSKVRIVTLTLAIRLLKKLIYDETNRTSYMKFEHLKRLDQSYYFARLNLKRLIKENFFLEMFDDEYRQFEHEPMKLKYLLKDASMLCRRSSTTSNTIELVKRLPSNENERTRRSIRVFLLIRALVLELNSIVDPDLPLTKSEQLLKANEIFLLANHELISCIVHLTDRKDHRLLAIDRMQMILIEHDTKRLDWGLVKMSHWIQNIEVIEDKDDIRSLYVTIPKATFDVHEKSKGSMLNVKLTFDDQVRSLMAKQKLIEACEKARQMRLSQIAAMLEVDIVDEDFKIDQSDTSTRSGSSSSHQQQSRPRIEQRTMIDLDSFLASHQVRLSLASHSQADQTRATSSTFND